jgi:hypothetical protein
LFFVDKIIIALALSAAALSNDFVKLRLQLLFKHKNIELGMLRDREGNREKR